MNWMSTLSKKTCAAFYKHTNIRSGNRVFPCCRFKTPVLTFDGNLSKILTSDVYEELRNTDVNDIPGCAKCIHEENTGKDESMREWFNRTYTTESVQLEYLEIGFDNICNAACDGCWSEFSHTWSKINNPDALPNTHIISSDELTEDIPSSVNKILFLGGEPLMTNRHRRLLETCADLSNMSVTYNTNGTFLLDDQTINLLNQCKEVEFILSVDGYGELNEKVRKNCHWHLIEKFINQIQNSDYKLLIHTVIHRNNWHGLKDLEQYITKNNFRWRPWILTYPPHLDIANADNKEEIYKFIQETNIPNKEHTLKHIKEAT